MLVIISNAIYIYVYIYLFTDSEHQTDEDTSADGKSKLVVLLFHVSYVLLTSVLHEEGRLIGIANFCADTILEERWDTAEGEEVLRVADS